MRVDTAFVCCGNSRRTDSISTSSFDLGSLNRDSWPESNVGRSGARRRRRRRRQCSRSSTKPSERGSRKFDAGMKCSGSTPKDLHWCPSGPEPAADDIAGGAETRLPYVEGNQRNAALTRYVVPRKVSSRITFTPNTSRVLWVALSQIDRHVAFRLRATEKTRR